MVADASPAPEMSDSSANMIAGRYSVLRTLGKGAFGRTILARDEQSGRDVAIKMLDTAKVDNWKGFELFEREAAVLRSVRHHGVPEIFDSFKAEFEQRNAAFLVMEYVEGESLESIIMSRRHLDPADASHILLELLGVLDYLHSRVPPILHRDIKPANIILRPDGYPALVDFGAVRSALVPSGLEGSTIVGTYGYMPYEQHMGQATPASDLYALAATFLHLLTGRAPPDFMNEDGRIAVPDQLPGGDRQKEVLSQMLRTSPAQRFQAAREVRQALLATETLPTATVGMTRLSTRQVPVPIDVAPAPRVLSGELEERYRRLAPSLWRLSTTEGSAIDGSTGMGVLTAIVVGIVTFGIYPLLVAGVGSARRRRLKHFFRVGQPAIAEITAIDGYKDEMGVQMGRVRFDFEADGAVHRASDIRLQSVTDRWRPGDHVEILYVPDADYDAVIISTR